MYIYPDNLKSKATLGLWTLKDIVVIGVMLLFGIFVFARTKLMLFMVIAGVYAFLTIRLDDVSVRDFIVYAARFFIFNQQHYEWRKTDVRKK